MFLGQLVFHPSSSSVEQAFVGRDEKRAPLNSPAWEARLGYAIKKLEKNYVPAILISRVTLSYVICFSAM